MPGDRRGFVFLGGPAVPRMVEWARHAEHRGFDSIWVAETRLTRDGFVPLAAIATATTRIRLGTGIVNVYTRGPVVMASSFATLEEVAPRRTVIGLGPGSPGVLATQGIEFVKPITRLREYVSVIRRLLTGECVTFEGETVRLQEARLEAPPSRSLPIYLGVTGPRALEVAGEIADGVLLNAFLPVEYVKRALIKIAAGAARRRRRVDDIEIAAMLVVSMDADESRAKSRIRPLVATYLSQFPNIARETGLDEATLRQIQILGADGVTEEVLDHLVVAGTPEQCRRRIQSYCEAGVQLPILAAIDNLTETIDTLGP